MELCTRQIKTDYGEITYYQYDNPNDSAVNLYIHGLGYNRKWFRQHFRRYELHRFSWIVPDLMGHGDSSKPKRETAYTMDNQADYIIKILEKEAVDKVRLIAHSMGGPIAVLLIGKLRQQKSTHTQPVLLLYLEGNLDAGDAFFSSRVVQMTLEEYQNQFESWYERVMRTTKDQSIRSWLESLYDSGSFTVWASSKDLVRVSKKGNILKLLKQNYDGPLYFLFGERNKGVYSSEKLVQNNDLPVIYIPKAGHAMHEDNPRVFWNKITELIRLTDKQ